MSCSGHRAFRLMLRLARHESFVPLEASCLMPALSDSFSALIAFLFSSWLGGVAAACICDAPGAWSLLSIRKRRWACSFVGAEAHDGGGGIAAAEGKNSVVKWLRGLGFVFSARDFSLSGIYDNKLSFKG